MIEADPTERKPIYYVYSKFLTHEIYGAKMKIIQNKCKNYTKVENKIVK